MAAVQVVDGGQHDLREKPLAIRLQGVTAGYGGDPILHAIDFRVSSGEFVGVIGPNGVGKTTLFKVIMGLVKPYRGVVEVLGRSLESRASRRWARLQTGYVTQQSGSGNMQLTVLDAVLLGRWGHYQYRYWPGPQDYRRAEEALRLVGMLPKKDADWRELSGGQQQRVSLARALVRSPRLLLLDEPTTYLDQSAQAELMDLIAKLHLAQGLTTVMVSHDLSMLRSYANAIYELTGRGLKQVR